MNEREDLLAMVASLYYKLHLSQGEIAERLGVSTSKVSRLLKDAWERGIIEVHIRTPIPRDFVLEQALITRFGLRDAYVLETKSEVDEHSLLTATGELAAGFLSRIIPTMPPGSTIGVAWGTGVQSTVNALPNNLAQKIDVVQLMGGVGALVVDGPDLARVVAAKLGGRHHDLHAPVLVERPEVRSVFLGEPAVREGIRRAQSVQLAITGIGTLDDKASSFLRAGLLTLSDLSQLRRAGAVGETIGRFFDMDGSSDGIEINQRIVGIELDDLRRIPQVLAVARGIPKATSILGALRGRFLTVLTTDDVTARAVLTLDDQDTRRNGEAQAQTVQAPAAP
jgi:DNA-binding transcriptional regulator LsrR (DeoR family)